MPLSTRRSFTRRTPRDLFGSNGLMADHSEVAEFVAHDPRLQFRSLKSRLGQHHQPTIAGRCVTNALNLLPLSVHSGHGRTCCWHDPVANDPRADVERW